ncbi:alpha/beta fold hydrolase [Streptomyces antimicrobicus]|uniref:Alpha/beta hydrolase n=1 Tax=Streptomyces antimicrobicus TaxID=2883108 RepID=A0ABS8BA80_9ACTN|nr:alpha/beta fold hydrolase [Streptomyces antimicrobicus]MCB5181530.1 alpha/beta hydrolase [Streptomyces antimicrobicus]
MNTHVDLRPVAVEHRGGSSGPRLLLLHGLAANDSVWERVLPELSTWGQVWTARLPWRTETIADWSEQPNLRGWLGKALEAVPGGAEVVVAHSMAANVLLDLLDQKNRGGVDSLRQYGIRGLVLVSPFYRGKAEEFDWDTISYYLNDFHLIMEEGIRAHSGGRVPDDVQQAMGERVRDRVGPHGWLRFFDLYLRTPALQTGRITAPALVLAGENDFAARPEEAVALAKALPDAACHVLPGSGHFPMLDTAGEFAAAVSSFVHSTMGLTPPSGAALLNALEPHA